MSVTTEKPGTCAKPLYETKLGKLCCGRCEDILRKYPLVRHKGKVQLVFTSPPFPLNRKKKYGNLQGKQYVDWLAGISPLLSEYLTPDGSIVMELGNAWESGSPTMSTLPIEALLAFKNAAGLHLCQEFICYNTARLPSPAQWVTVERIRVKDSFTRVWWMSPTPKPKADNRRVLTQYSASMKELLRKGTYNAGRRPSEHTIGETSFLSDHGGAIPPNVLLPPIKDLLPELYEVLPIANTHSHDPYQLFCRENGIEPHPARMPAKLVEFFVLMLTDPGDRVLDPFAGSNTTGFVAEQLGRRWLSIEAERKYALASRARFRVSTLLSQDGSELECEPILQKLDERA